MQPHLFKMPLENFLDVEMAVIEFGDHLRKKRVHLRVAQRHRATDDVDDPVRLDGDEGAEEDARRVGADFHLSPLHVHRFYAGFVVHGRWQSGCGFGCGFENGLRELHLREGQIKRERRFRAFVLVHAVGMQGIATASGH